MERRANLEEITAKVRALVSASEVARYVKKIELIPDLDGDDDEFLRVELSLATPSRVRIKDLQVLSRAIHDAVDEVDERFASVRFPDAA